MKTLAFLLTGIFLLTCNLIIYSASQSGKKKADNNPIRPAEYTIKIQSTPDLFILTKTWATEYVKVHPGVNIDVDPISDVSTLLSSSKNGSDLSFISDKYISSLERNEIWNMVIGHEAIIPVISPKNPFMDKIRKQGVSPDELDEAMNNPEKQTWGFLLGNSHEAPVHFYMVDNASVKSQILHIMKVNPKMINRINVGDSRELLSTIQDDPYAIGFCRMTDLLEPVNAEMERNIKLLPLDKNMNGQLEYFENIYNDLSDFGRGVWIGKYPKRLSTTIYSLSSSKSLNKAETAFLSWVITDGQKFLNPAGFNDIVTSSRNASNLAALAQVMPKSDTVSGTGFFVHKLHDLSIFSMIVIGLLPFIIAFMIIDAVIRNKKVNQPVVSFAGSPSSAIFDENSVEGPKGLYYDKSHSWAFMEKNGAVRIGLDDFLQHVTGPLTRIIMKNPGEKVKKGESLFSIIQNGKKLTIHSPLTGIIRDQNSKLATDSSMLNSSPYFDGWIYLIEPVNWTKEMQFLFMGETYKEWLTKEFSRLKDFLAVSLRAKDVEYAHVIMQDGGEIRDGILTDLGPEIWEEFQTTFIDGSR